MVKKIKLLMMIPLFLLMFTGCKSKNDLESGQSLIKTTNPAPIELGKNKEQVSFLNQVKEEIDKIDEIYDVAVIEGEKQILIAYKVKHLKRFQMKKIEKELKTLLEEKFPEDEVVVSSDYKIFLEAIRLKKAVDDKKVSKKEADKRLKYIIKLQKEMT